MEGQSTAAVTVDVIAAELQVTVRTIQNWRKRFGLPFKKIGGALRFDLEEVRQSRFEPLLRKVERTCARANGTFEDRQPHVCAIVRYE